MISQGSTERARRPEPEQWEYQEPLKLRDGVCRMCGERKPLIEVPVIGGLFYVCAECWEYHKDL